MTWKKWTALFMTLLLALGLTACQNEKRVDGLVVEVQTDASGNVSAFVVEDRGERTGILIAEKTSLWPRSGPEGGSWTGEEARRDFQAQLQVDTVASAWCYPRREKLETAEGTVNAYWAQSANIDGTLERAVLALRDGTPVDVLEEDWWSGCTTYRLADGTELLRVDGTVGPENVYVGNQEGFESLSEQVQEKILAYYEERGLLYDEMEELEKSYAAYLELGKEFSCDHVGQEVAPTAASERVVYFLTSVSLPLDYGERVVRSVDICDAFDRRTGERIEIPDLFAVPWEEVCRLLPELVDWEMEPDIAAQISERLEPEYLAFYPETLSVWVPAGTLEEEDYKDCTYGFSVSYSAAPEGFFQPWAVPKSTEE